MGKSGYPAKDFSNPTSQSLHESLRQNQTNQARMIGKPRKKALFNIEEINGEVPEDNFFGLSTKDVENMVFFQNKIFKHYGILKVINEFFNKYLSDFLTEFRLNPDIFRCIIYNFLNPLLEDGSMANSKNNTYLHPKNETYLHEFFILVRNYFPIQQSIEASDESNPKKHILRIFVLMSLGIFHEVAYCKALRFDKKNDPKKCSLDNKLKSLFQESSFSTVLNILSEGCVSFTINLPGSGDCATTPKHHHDGKKPGRVFTITECKWNPSSAKKAFHKLLKEGVRNKKSNNRPLIDKYERRVQFCGCAMSNLTTLKPSQDLHFSFESFSLTHEKLLIESFVGVNISIDYLNYLENLLQDLFKNLEDQISFHIKTGFLKKALEENPCTNSKQKDIRAQVYLDSGKFLVASAGGGVPIFPQHNLFPSNRNTVNPSLPGFKLGNKLQTNLNKLSPANRNILDKLQFGNNDYHLERNNNFFRFLNNNN
jgi:hypothetical protein